MGVIAPMLPCDGPLPEGAGWVGEPKIDGWRALVRVRGDGSVSLVSRRGRSLTHLFPEVVDAFGGCAPVMLDGELVAFDAAGRPDFHLLRARDRPPAGMVAFDILESDGRVLVDEPWRSRRRLLEAVELPASVQPVVYGDVRAMWDVTAEQGLEGVVAKHVDSRYEVGRRSRWWVRRKHWTVSELAVVAYVVDRGRPVRLITSDGTTDARGVVEIGVSAAVGDALVRHGGEAHGAAVRRCVPGVVVRVRHHGSPARPRDAQCLGLVTCSG